MIHSKQQNYSEAQVITVTANSTNVIDHGAAGTPLGAPTTVPRDAGKGTPIELNIQVVVTFATLTSLKVGIQTDDDEAFGTAVTVLESPAIAAAALVAGYKFPLRFLPPGVNKRYTRLVYTVAGAAATLGKITAGVVAGPHSNT